MPIKRTYPDSKPSDLVQGTLEMLILKTLALEPMHGYGVGLRIEQISGGVFKVNAGSLAAGAQPDGASRKCEVRVAGHRKESPGEILSSDRKGPQGALRGNRRVAASDRRDCTHSRSMNSPNQSSETRTIMNWFTNIARGITSLFQPAACRT